MRKLIRCKRTKAFFAADGAWTRDIRRGLRLSAPGESKAVSERLNLHEVEIYYSFEADRECEWDFALPMH
jgi:hypothetical protein